MLRHRIQCLEKKIRRQQTELLELRKFKKRACTKKFAHQIVKKTLEKSFSKPQTKVIVEKKIRPGKWSEEDVVTGLLIRSFSKKCFDFIREKKLFPLPGSSTLRNWVKNFKCQPGMMEEMKQVLKKFLEGEAESSSLAKLAMLSFDEMEICHRYEFDQAADKVFGPFKKVQLVMLRGLCHKWRQPVFYDFDTPMKRDLLFSVIQSAEETGVIVCGITFDLGNHGLLSSLGVSPEKPFFEHPANSSRKIFVFPDAPHLLKLCRNHLLDDGYRLDEETVIKKDDFEQLLKKDNKELKICHKLSLAHLDCLGNSRQRVRPAAQLLSHTTATAFRCLFPEKKKQADWIQGPML